MANEIDINIGSFDLEDSTNGVAIAEISVAVAKSVQQFALPKYHGSVIPIGKRTALNVRLQGTIKGSAYDDLRSKLDALKAAFESSSEQSLTLDDDRILKVQYKNFSYGYKALRTLADFSVELVASDPFWYAASLTTSSAVRTSGAGFTINNPGNAPTRVKLQISNSGSAIADDCKVENQTTGELLQYRGTLAAADDLIINNRVDAEDVAVTNDGTDDIANFEGDFITLNPGNNTIVFTGTAGTTVAVIYRAAYL